MIAQFSISQLLETPLKINKPAEERSPKTNKFSTP